MHITFENIIGNLKRKLKRRKMWTQKNLKLVNLNLSNVVLLIPLIPLNNL